jgi:alanine or glycine:cation symporter, AGCS family
MCLILKRNICYYIDMLETVLENITGLIWYYIVSGLCLFGGIYFTLKLKLIQIRSFPHAIALIRGKYDHPGEHGQISHFQALSAALSATVGLGNIAGVAIAIAMGGPGAVFWMWIMGFLAMATKYIECTLGTHYRHKDEETGEMRGGAMYYISKGLGKKWTPMAIMFAICISLAAIIVGSLFQTNQAAAAIHAFYGIPKITIGIIVFILSAAVIIGGIKRIGKVASAIVPLMCIIYVLGAIVICIINFTKLPTAALIILQDAFTGKAAAGGAVGAVILMGIRRAIFSNEAGLGSAPIAHAAVKTDYPVREGIVATLEPLIDTIIVCTATALVIILSGNFGTEIFKPIQDLNITEKTSLISPWQIKKEPIIKTNQLQNYRQSENTLSYSSKQTRNKSYIIGPLDLKNKDGIRFSYKISSGDFAIRLLNKNKNIIVHKQLFTSPIKLYKGIPKTGLNPHLVSIFGFYPSNTWKNCVVEFEKSFKNQINSNNDFSEIYFELVPMGNNINWSFDRIQIVNKLNGINLTTVSFDKFFQGFGSIFITIAVFFFAFSTIITWSYYGETAASYVFGKRIIIPYRWAFILLAIVGSVLNLNLIVNLGDLLLGLVVIPNFIAILLLSNKVKRWTKIYFRKLKTNKLYSPNK